MSSGDEHYRKKQQKADNADEKTVWDLFHLMRRIGDEMHKETGAMSLSGARQILDLCMAPGGYSASALKINPRATLIGITLPEELGGYELLLRAAAGPGVIELDLTSLIGDLGIGNEVPNEHSDFGKFRRREMLAGRQFDFILCDGQVLRNHMEYVTEHRQQREATRLVCSQLLIALRRVTVGGTIVELLHRMDAWNTALTLHVFEQFASIRVFNPTVGYRGQTSYLVAKHVQPAHQDARKAIKAWSHFWKEATFGSRGDDVQGEAAPEGAKLGKVTEDQVKKFLDDYGERLAELGDDAWKLQKDGIKNSPWFKKRKRKAP